MTLHQLSFVLAMAGTVAFSSSAVLAVADRKVDLFAAIVLGVITAVGGGTVRDVIMDVPVFWATDLSYLWVSIGASVATFLAAPFFARRSMRSLFLYIDGLAIAMFAVQAMEKVWRLNFALPVGPLMLAVTTAIGGGLIRDVLVQRPTLLMSRELYAVPVLLGCILYALIRAFAPQYAFPGAIVSLFVIFGIRAAAIHWNLSVPGWATMGRDAR